jgi:hypothetical protein
MSAADVQYELLVSAEGATLTCGGEVMWTSDGDEGYAEEFGGEALAVEDEEQMDDLLGWLVDEGYVPPGVDVDILEETEDLSDAT